MGENAQKIGKKLETVGVDLLQIFNWTVKMSDKEIKCKRSSHKNKAGNSKQTHGIDMYLEYEDPYIGKTQGVFIECKNRAWAGITKENIEGWLEEEINLLECAMNTPELQEFYSKDGDKNSALILINCNDDNFDSTKFHEYLSKLQVPGKRMPYKIFIAGNDTINKWDAIDRLIKENYRNGIKVLSPSINNSQPFATEYWSINQLFSKYIFCEVEEKHEEEDIKGKTIRINKKLVVFCFDKICAESFQYMWSMCRFYNYESTYTGFDVCYWTETKEEHDYITENLKNILISYKDKIDKKVIDTINVKFLLNRNLNVIDNR